MTAAHPRPGRIAQRQRRLGLRPPSLHEQRGAAVAQPGCQARGIGIRHPGRRPHRDHRHHLGHRRHHCEPPRPRVGDEHEPLEVDAGLLDRLRTELRHPDRRAPRTRLRRTCHERHHQRRRGLQRVGGAGSQPPAGQQRGQYRMHRQHRGVQAPALRALELCPQRVEARRPLIRHVRPHLHRIELLFYSLNCEIERISSLRHGRARASLTSLPRSNAGGSPRCRRIHAGSSDIRAILRRRPARQPGEGPRDDPTKRRRG